MTTTKTAVKGNAVFFFFSIRGGGKKKNIIKFNVEFKMTALVVNIVAGA